MPILNRIRYNSGGDFPYEMSLVFKDQYSYETWVINNTMISGVKLLESTAINESEGMSIISYEEPIVLETSVEEAVVEEVPVKKTRKKVVAEEKEEVVEAAE